MILSLSHPVERESFPAFHQILLRSRTLHNRFCHLIDTIYIPTMPVLFEKQLNLTYKNIQYLMSSWILSVVTPCFILEASMVSWFTHVYFGLPMMCALVYPWCVFWFTHDVCFGLPMMCILVYPWCVFWFTHDVCFGLPMMCILVYPWCVFWFTHVCFGLPMMCAAIFLHVRNGWDRYRQ